jgi:L-threonylcarbamoyladenylate synthase
MSSAPILPAIDAASLDRAAERLRAGGLVAVPTETVYGLAADATDSRAVARIYEAKGRPRFNPLIAHVDSLERAESLVHLSASARALAAAFWPGPLTLVAPLRDGAEISELVTAGLTTLAVRWPASPAMTGLIARTGRPLAAPSANPSGSVSPTTAEHVADGLGDRIDLILDGGPCRVGVESTILAVDETGARLLRPGGLTRSEIEAVLGHALDDGDVDTDAPTAPGQLSSHYAPQASIRLEAAAPEPGEAYLAFGPTSTDWSGPVFNLSPAGDLVEAAANLFSGLRLLDRKADRIAVAPIPREGLGEAINDRLKRASAPR